MIKKIIFDIDNTLLDWDDENYVYAVTSACNKIGIEYNQKLDMQIRDAMDNYENCEEYFDRNKLHSLICKMTEKNFNIEFTNEILEVFSKCVPNKLEDGIVETLEYLSSKYELVALTNWFEEEQARRLKIAGIDKYFKKIYGTEKIKIKPNEEAFITACGKYKVDECVMVGDNFKTDIEGALAAGLNAVFLNKNEKIFDLDVVNKSKFKEIHKIKELMELF